MKSFNSSVMLFTASLLWCLSVHAELEEHYLPLDNSVEFREMLGHLLAQQDWAAEVGTDALKDLGADLYNKKLQGFIVEHNETHWTLSYLGKRGFSTGIYYQINITHEGPVLDSYQNHSASPVKLDDIQKSIHRAVKTAGDADKLLCSQTYNPVVLPLTLGDQSYLYTYLLAATNQQGITVMGGHHRFIISENGKKIVQHKAHTNSCLTMEQQEDSAAQVVTHFNDTIPNEIHIYMSYLYDTPLYVMITADQTLWKVLEGKITLVTDEQEDDTERPVAGDDPSN